MRAAHFACEHGHVGALEVLLEHRADINASDKLGNTPLMFSMKDSAEILHVAIERSADIYARNIYGMCALDLAVMHGRMNAVEVLLQAGSPVSRCADGPNALHHGCSFGAGEAITKMLIEARVSVHDRVEPRTARPLWVVFGLWSFAYRLGRRSFLARFGYHVWGATPLMFAAMFDYPAQAAVMLEHGADPDSRNERGLTAQELSLIFKSS